MNITGRLLYILHYQYHYMLAFQLKIHGWESISSGYLFFMKGSGEVESMLSFLKRLFLKLQYKRSINFSPYY